MSISRRKFLQFSTVMPALSQVIDLGKINESSTVKSVASIDVNLYESLLKKWTEALYKLQVRQISIPQLNGGILCPAGARIRGRCFDAILPFMYMAHHLNESKYLDAAVQLQKWSDNVSLPDGSWVNEPITSNWQATTVFSFITMAESIINFGHLLNSADRDKWMTRSRKAAGWLYEHLTFSFNSNINYPVSASTAMALAGLLFDDKSYMQRSKDLAHQALHFFTPDNCFLFGEGKPRTSKSPKGCYPIDLGYNVEESLPNLVLYAKIMKDEEVLATVENSLRTHLEFMLPDGAWDNSWGTRNFKWTYWGSRTTDGCQVAYGLLADKNPLFAEAACRNLQLLNSCTHQGILYGGPHFKLHGAAPSIHHTFCHAKALATCLVLGIKVPEKPMQLPRENTQQKKYYREIDTWLVAKKDWKATITGYDWVYKKNDHASGGAISMLWHKLAGPILSASLSTYIMHERDNMQPMYEPDSMALTPRIEAVVKGVVFDNINDLAAQITPMKNKQSTSLRCTGKLVNNDYKEPENGSFLFSIIYDFYTSYVSIIIEANSDYEVDELRFVLPVISNHKEDVIMENNTIAINKEKCILHISSSNKPILLNNFRIFNFVPGFEALPIVYKLIRGQALNIKIAVK